MTNTKSEKRHRWGRIVVPLLAVASLGLAGVTATPAAAARKPTTTTSPAEPPSVLQGPTCDQARADAPAQKRAGRTVGSCVEHTPAKTKDEAASTARSVLSAPAGASVAQAQAVGSGLPTCSGVDATLINGWFIGRRDACFVGEVNWILFNLNNPKELYGEVAQDVAIYVNTTTNGLKNSDLWNSVTGLQVKRIWGFGVNSTIRGWHSCTGNTCSITNSNWPEMVFSAVGQQSIGTAIFKAYSSSVVVASQGNGYNFSNWQYSNQYATSVVVQRSPGAVRCDHNLKGWIDVGCVFPARIPVLTYSSVDLPAIVYHVRRAEGSGLPGAPGKSPLHRAYSDALRDANRNRACQAAGAYLPPNLDPAKSCDEFPFATTYEGAYAQPYLSGRTFNGCNILVPVPEVVLGAKDIGYSICVMPDKQNGDGGSQLGGMYTSNRVLDHDPFYVTTA